MLALRVYEPYVTKILQGSKKWEIRSCNCKTREIIGLIPCGSKKVIGEVEITDSIGPLSIDELMANYSKHLIPLKTLEDMKRRWKRKTLYAWVLKNPKLLSKPIRFKNPKGAMVWVKITEDLIE